MVVKVLSKILIILLIPKVAAEAPSHLQTDRRWQCEYVLNKSTCIIEEDVKKSLPPKNIDISTESCKTDCKYASKSRYAIVTDNLDIEQYVDPLEHKKRSKYKADSDFYESPDVIKMSRYRFENNNKRLERSKYKLSGVPKQDYIFDSDPLKVENSLFRRIKENDITDYKMVKTKTYRQDSYREREYLSGITRPIEPKNLNAGKQSFDIRDYYDLSGVNKDKKHRVTFDFNDILNHQLTPKPNRMRYKQTFNRADNVRFEKTINKADYSSSVYKTENRELPKEKKNTRDLVYRDNDNQKNTDENRNSQQIKVKYQAKDWNLEKAIFHNSEDEEDDNGLDDDDDDDDDNSKRKNETNRPRTVYTLWDYFDPGLLRSNISRSRSPPKVLRMIYDDPYYNSTKEPYTYKRPDMVTLFHSFPRLNLPFIVDMDEDTFLAKNVYGFLWTIIIPLMLFAAAVVLFFFVFISTRKRIPIGRWHLKVISSSIFQDLLLGVHTIIVIFSMLMAILPFSGIFGFHAMLLDLKIWVHCCKIDGNPNFACKSTCPKDDIIDFTIPNIKSIYTKTYTNATWDKITAVLTDFNKKIGDFQKSLKGKNKTFFNIYHKIIMNYSRYQKKEKKYGLVLNQARRYENAVLSEPQKYETIKNELSKNISYAINTYIIEMLEKFPELSKVFNTLQIFWMAYTFLIIFFAIARYKLVLVCVCTLQLSIIMYFSLILSPSRPWMLCHIRNVKLVGFISVSLCLWIMVAITTVVFMVYCEIGYNFVDVYVKFIFNGMRTVHRRIFQYDMPPTTTLWYFATCRGKDRAIKDFLMSDNEEKIELMHRIDTIWDVISLYNSSLIYDWQVPKHISDIVVDLNDDLEQIMIDHVNKTLNCAATKKKFYQLDEKLFDSGTEILLLYTFGCYVCAICFVGQMIALVLFTN